MIKQNAVEAAAATAGSKAGAIIGSVAGGVVVIMVALAVLAAVYFTVAWYHTKQELDKEKLKRQTGRERKRRDERYVEMPGYVQVMAEGMGQRHKCQVSCA